MTDTFNGDNAALCRSAIALLNPDAKGALVPHGIGNHARDLLSAFVARLPTLEARVATLSADGPAEVEIDRLRLAAFKTNSNEDKAAYYLAVSAWFQDRHLRAAREASR